MRRHNIGNQLIQALVIGLLVLTAAGCGESFDVTYAPQGECWDIDQHVTLTASISTASVRPELLLNFDQDYPFTNLQLTMSCSTPSGEVEVYEFQTTVLSATGDWLIEPTAGGHQVVIALADEFTTAEPGEYTFSLMHNMRDDQICGIRSVGLRLPK